MKKWFICATTLNFNFLYYILAIQIHSVVCVFPKDIKIPRLSFIVTNIKFPEKHFGNF